VNWKGEGIKDVGNSFATALDYAGLPAHFTPHILRHTRVTWWVEAGLPIEEVADAAGMTVEMVERVYWHRSPYFQKRAAEV
jgi:integrase